MQVSILGPVALMRDGVVVPVGGARVRALLARLALAAGSPVPPHELIDAIWRDAPPVDATNALQTLVSRLRRAAGDACTVVQEPGGYRLPLSAADVDAFRFSELARTGRARLREGHPDTAAQQLREALQLWRGPALPELDDPAPAARLDEQRLDALEDRIEAAIQLDGGADVVAECEALAADHPLRERFTWLLMTALAGAGRTNEALAGYERLRRYLVDQLGTDPSAELQRLHLTLLRSEPERPSRTVTRTNLRTGRTTFLGRADELNRIAELLESGRLVTVVGPGGAGKTRLAGVAASDWVGRLDDGVWLVELAPVTDPVNLAQAILGSLGLRANTTVDRRAEQACPPRTGCSTYWPTPIACWYWTIANM